MGKEALDLGPRCPRASRARPAPGARPLTGSAARGLPAPQWVFWTEVTGSRSRRRDILSPPTSCACSDAGAAPACLGFGTQLDPDPPATGRARRGGPGRPGDRAPAPRRVARGRDLGDDVVAVRTGRDDWLFPRCAAVVHHGAAGTTATGAARGTPSVLVPHNADQFTWRGASPSCARPAADRRPGAHGGGRGPRSSARPRRTASASAPRARRPDPGGGRPRAGGRRLRAPLWHGAADPPRPRHGRSRSARLRRNHAGTSRPNSGRPRWGCSPLRRPWPGRSGRRAGRGLGDACHPRQADHGRLERRRPRAARSARIRARSPGGAGLQAPPASGRRPVHAGGSGADQCPVKSKLGTAVLTIIVHRPVDYTRSPSTSCSTGATRTRSSPSPSSSAPGSFRQAAEVDGALELTFDPLPEPPVIPGVQLSYDFRASPRRSARSGR